MEKFGVQLGLEGLREARQEWAKRKREFDTGYHRVMAVLLHEAARNFMSVEQIAEFAGLSKVRVRSLMRMAGLNPSDGKRVLSDKAAKALVENADLMGIKPHEMDLLSPLAYLPMGDDLRHKLQEQTVSQVTELPEEHGCPVCPDGKCLYTGGLDSGYGTIDEAVHDLHLRGGRLRPGALCPTCGLVGSRS
jgi:hypothetical protein